ncbi:MAG: glutamate synthase subunit beta [Candidatus Delongbacteria bacterium]|nr:glutamate synthase subunit beta [Candidatus Delongbacteria bacterium]
MANAVEFIEIQRIKPIRRAIEERIRDYREIELPVDPEILKEQAGRCQDCGIPFCHSLGCPLGNLIPDFNEMVHQNQWRRALDYLHHRNNFPEITGRICPGLCEPACTLAMNFEPVMIRSIERQIAETGWQEGWIRPEPAAVKQGTKVAVIGSGPAGLAAAQQLARWGHDVIVFERSERIGGLLRYGIPDFKLEKWILDRRIEQLKAEGIIFETGVEVGHDVSTDYLRRKFQAVLIAIGSGRPRDLPVPDRNLSGIHWAMDYLSHQTRCNNREQNQADPLLTATGKKVAVIGGGDTGADCIGTARRQCADAICQLEILPRPPALRDPSNPWPEWPRILRSSSSHEEGCDRRWSIKINAFGGREGRLTHLDCVKLEWEPAGTDEKLQPREISGSEFKIPVDMAILAMGFIHPEPLPLLEPLQIHLNPNQTIAADSQFRTSIPNFFGAGDCVAGASLVVKAIDQGRQAAAAIHRTLK